MIVTRQERVPGIGEMGNETPCRKAEANGAVGAKPAGQERVGVLDGTAGYSSCSVGRMRISLTSTWAGWVTA